MDVLRHDLFFWQLVHYFVTERHFRVLDMNQKEVWLESEETKSRKVLRVIRTDIDWGNHLKQDASSAVTRFEALRRQLGLRQLEGENLYVTVFPPVDDWSDLREPTYADRKKKTKVYTSLLIQDEIEREKALMEVGERLHMSLPTFLEAYEDSETLIREYRKEIKQAANARMKRERELFLYGKPIMTFVLLAMIGVMYALLERNGGSTNLLTLIEFGAKYNPAIIEGEWWRFFSSMFLHIGFLHLFMNSLALFYLGGTVERIYGTSRFILIYFTAGLFGSIASFAFNEQVAAGASGAIFGCFGALLYFGTIYRKLFLRTMGMNLLVILGINLAFGFAIPVIDNGAHIGGLIGGYLASSIVHLPNHKGRARQVAMLGVTLFLTAALYVFGLSNEEKAGSEIMDVQIGQEYIQADEIEQAYSVLKGAVENGTEMPEAYFLLSYTEAHLERYEDAKKHLLKTIELRPTFHEAHYNLALVYLELAEVEHAFAAVERAVELEPAKEDYQRLYETVQDRLEGEGLQ
ncbi:rhomboid family intramembrane serine protease [Halalkalibacterium ligniniphilum]|uniref:rhomboid family intramembrane serine protease n=1 Tax=Halalkalibacterium ligniniphilum TaxID=1134413 RepID=UPI00034A59B9|nr:rhomboid family intramembrane serine protease [Halalkalibacterium ligniniphilum]